MNKLKYHLVSPDGNPTAIIRDPLPEGVHVKLAKIIMETVELVEAVGFMEEPINRDADFRLRMMGNEFCGNALRGAAFLNRDNGKSVVESSGIEDLVQVDTNNNVSKMVVPGSLFIGFRLVKEGIIIDMGGIKHLIVNSENSHFDGGQLVEKYRNDCPAFGVIYVKARNSGEIAIEPYVWVRQTETLVHETACASGSIAAFLYNYIKSGDTQLTIKQPSGKSYLLNIGLEGIVINSITLESGISYLGNGTVHFSE